MTSIVIAAPRTKQIVTPEGVPLEVEIAPMGDRCLALLLDMFLLALTALVLFLFTLALQQVLGGWSMAFFFLGLFLVRNFYFAFFEIRWQGATPGKRWRGLRVISRYGASLQGEAVFARNLIREVEVFWPMIFLFSAKDLSPHTSPWAGLAMFAWIMVFLFLPFLNKDRLRAGDLLGGTMVVTAPRTLLLADLSTSSTAGSEQRREARYAFTTAQLSIYGIYELQVLEEVLRMPARDRRRAASVVCDKIKKKIDWPREEWNVDVNAFLDDFYAAQRAHLEQGLLMGQRVEKKRA